MKSSGEFEVHCCSFFVEIRTPVRRVLPVAGASSGAAREFGCKCWVEWPLPGDGWAISAALDSWEERLSFLVVCREVDEASAVRWIAGRKD